jgi:apolipoprotein N-acyltransferase
MSKRPDPVAFLKAYAPVLVSAALMALSRRFHVLGFLSFAALIPLFRFFEWNARTRERSGLTAGFLYMLIYAPIALYWISMTAQYATITTGPAIRIGLTAGIFIGVIIVLSVSHMACFWAIQRVWRNWPRLGWLGALLLWTGLEYGLTRGDFRFPWLNLGYSLADYNVLLQAADLGGVYLLTLFVIGVNLLLMGILRQPKRNGILLGAIAILWTGYGILRLHTIHPAETQVKIGVVQPSVPQDVKWDIAFYEETMMRLARLTDSLSAQGAQMVIWPESSVPVPLLRFAAAKRFVIAIAEKDSTCIFTGFEHFIDVQPNPAADATYFNSASMFHPDGVVDPLYFKMALAPFGERMPLLSVFPFLWKVSLGQANFQPGDARRYYSIGGLRFTPTICYEMAFPELVLAGSDADFYVNVTNDAWYRDSAGTRQHAEFARFRAIETRRTIFRAANTGFSFYVDPLGREHQRTALLKQTGFVATAPVWRGASIYSRFLPHFGFVLTISGLFLLACTVIRPWRRG